MAMNPNQLLTETEVDNSTSTRRQFLQTVTRFTASAAVLSELSPRTTAADAASNALLPTTILGPYRVTRLIIGGNPIYGYSHFNRILSQYQTTWHTQERVIQLLQHAEAKGINTWQNSYAERTLADLEKYRERGGHMHWLCLGKPDWDEQPHFINEAAKHHPIGIAPHGSLAERLHRQNKLGVLTDLLKRIRDTGVLVGLSAHNPQLVQLAMDKSWDIDYFMCCLYYLTRPREEFQKLLGGELPIGEIYLSSYPPRMFQVIQKVTKPCLVYKVFAAGRRIESLAQIRQCFQTAFNQIKPTDAIIVGMYQQLSDQVSENTGIVREICAR